MQSSNTRRPAIIILGSGCAGSLLAWILARKNIEVVLIDRGHHPRFAIGESSTPLADFLMEQIADEYDLPELKPMARWGSWRRTYPHLRCGKKRGFSYFGHRSHADFTDSEDHNRSLLVTASVNDDVSDTHWMRSDVDQWLCQQARAAGAELLEDTSVEVIERSESGWRVSATRAGERLVWEPQWLIDATGNSGLVPQVAGASRHDELLLTRTGTLFGHFVHVQPMTDWLNKSNFATAGDPFDCDDAAQHHVLDDGWIYMLRFDCGITSVGITRPTEIWKREGIVDRDRNRAWKETEQRYPTFQALMSQAELIGPEQNGQVQNSVQLGWMPRISRLWSDAAGDRWLALPSTVGVVDPLHSTGLAHALSGVRRAANLLLQPLDSHEQRSLASMYQRDVVTEVRWIDQLVSSCYAALPDFELFAAMCSFYFIAAIECERDMRFTGQMQHGFLGAQRSQWRAMVEATSNQLTSGKVAESATARSQFLERLSHLIEPWNPAGLLDPSHRNRYARSAAPK